MSKISAGILVFRFRKSVLEVLLVHPGGPFWAKKDNHAWSIPKGEVESGETDFNAANREFTEETGIEIRGNFFALDPVKQSGGKTVYAWAVEKDITTEKIKSNNFEIEWPPNSGKHKSFPEVDKASWFDIETARDKIIKGQSNLLDQLSKKLTR
ncbi:MAG TPA: NUDIX domain-containing protein [Bacteroidales bacterium]|nr:NUDIX domain-containing protein [Bacteroidales bacterium]